jgi:hypothetical protein
MPGPLIPLPVYGVINISFTAFEATNTVNYTITGVLGGPLTGTEVVTCVSPSYPIICYATPIFVEYDTIQCERITVSGTVMGDCSDQEIPFEEEIPLARQPYCDGNYIFTCDTVGGCDVISTGNICPLCPNFDNIPANVPYDANGASLQTRVRNPAWNPITNPSAPSALLATKIPIGANFNICPSDLDWFEENYNMEQWTYAKDPLDQCCIDCEVLTVIIYDWEQFAASIPANSPVPQVFYTRCPSVSDNSNCYRRASAYLLPNSPAAPSGAITLISNVCVVKGSVSFLGFDDGDSNVCSITYTSSSNCPS